MMPTQPDPNEWISEDELADQLNVPREKIRAERPHLGPGEVTKKSNVVTWLRSAGERIAGKLGLSLPPTTAAPAPAPTTAAQPPEPGEELTVTSSPMRSNGPHFGNQFLIQARRKNGEIVVVRVLNSSRFMPTLRTTGEPMTIRAEKYAAGNWWTLIGREPRFPGQW